MFLACKIFKFKKNCDMQKKYLYYTFGKWHASSKRLAIAAFKYTFVRMRSWVDMAHVGYTIITIINYYSYIITPFEVKLLKKKREPMKQNCESI